jgi:hypothetical protein
MALNHTWHNDFTQYEKHYVTPWHATRTFCRDDVQTGVYLPDTWEIKVP